MILYVIKNAEGELLSRLQYDRWQCLTLIPYFMSKEQSTGNILVYTSRKDAEKVQISLRGSVMNTSIGILSDGGVRHD